MKIETGDEVAVNSVCWLDGSLTALSNHNNKIQTSFAAMLAIQNFGFHSFQNEISLSMKLQQKKWKKCLIAFQCQKVSAKN